MQAMLHKLQLTLWEAFLLNSKTLLPPTLRAKYLLALNEVAIINKKLALST